MEKLARLDGKATIIFCVETDEKKNGPKSWYELRKYSSNSFQVQNSTTRPENPHIAKVLKITCYNNIE